MNLRVSWNAGNYLNSWEQFLKKTSAPCSWLVNFTFTWPKWMHSCLQGPDRSPTADRSLWFVADILESASFVSTDLCGIGRGVAGNIRCVQLRKHPSTGAKVNKCTSTYANSAFVPVSSDTRLCSWPLWTYCFTVMFVKTSVIWHVLYCRTRDDRQVQIFQAER
jgi:hypothetical protein